MAAIPRAEMRDRLQEEKRIPNLKSKENIMAPQNKEKNSGLNGLLIGILAVIGALAAFLPIILTSIVF